MSIQKIFFSLFTPTEIIKAHLLYKEKKKEFVNIKYAENSNLLIITWKN